MDIKFKDFEGPLDLLLHLVSKYQMDIYEVPLIEVIEQYLAYLATLQTMKLEVAGEYMLMASQLTLIKSRRLLPKVAEEMDEAEDLEQDLLSQLEELQLFLDGVYLFDNKGKSYSRQWGFRQLEAFLIEKGNQDLSAQSIREQYILKQRELGVDLFSIARELGLKTMVTLEKYK